MSLDVIFAPVKRSKAGGDMGEHESQFRRRLVLCRTHGSSGNGRSHLGHTQPDGYSWSTRPIRFLGQGQHIGSTTKPQALHRTLFDTTSSAGLGQAVAFADVYFNVNKKSYGVDAANLSVLIVMHHFSTPFGFDDAIWSKYGKAISDKGDHVTDPRTKRAPTLNVYNTEAIDSLKNGGTTLDSLSEKGARFAVCDTATHGIANLLSKITPESADTIYAELTGHLIHNAVLVPAGITAINLAQERG